MDKPDIPQIKTNSVLEPPQLGINKQIKFSEDAEENPVMENKMAENKSTRKLKMPKLFGNLGPRGKKILAGVLIFIVLVTALLGVFIGIPAFSTYKKAKVLVAQAHVLKDSLNSQDISIIESEFGKFKQDFDDVENSYKGLLWAKAIPFFGNYVSDGEAGLNAGKYGIETAEIIIDTIRPYADIIGLAAGSGEDTANDRIEFIVQTIGDVLPRLDEISAKVSQIQAEVDKIDPGRYPEKIGNTEIQPNIIQAKDLLDQSATILTESKPLLESAPYLLGIDGTRKYLLIFQNDKELRPTGGFMTGYSIVEVSNGKFHPVRSSDIYDLDAKYTPAVPAPDLFKDYLKGPYLVVDKYRLRDMNWNPDFEKSMELFLGEVKKVGVEDIDGVIAVDTQVVVNILDVLGEIGVSGYGNFSTKPDERCNCPQVIYELEDFADIEGPVVWNQDGSGEVIYAPANYGRRKEIIGPLMNSILSNALGQPKEKLPSLFEAAFKSITEKHVLLYLFDEKAQGGAKGANFAGTIKPFEGDYLNVNDANLGGRKSNLYVTQEVTQDIEVAKDGSVVKTVTLTYANTQDFDGWLNSVLPNWTRVYVPKGAELIDSDGFNNEAQVYEELDKTVFAGGFELRPNGVKKITLKYKLPMKFDKNYGLLIQKQPGKDNPLYTINLGRKTEEFFLRMDRQVDIRI